MEDRFGADLRVSAERWRHIVTTHPEIKSNKDIITQVLLNPDIVVASPADRNVWIYHQRKSPGRYWVVVAHSVKRFVITAFVTSKIKRGTIVWQQKKDS